MKIQKSENRNKLDMYHAFSSFSSNIQNTTIMHLSNISKKIKLKKSEENSGISPKLDAKWFSFGNETLRSCPEIGTFRFIRASDTQTK